MIPHIDSLVDHYSSEHPKETIKNHDYFTKSWALNKVIKVLLLLVGSYALATGESKATSASMAVASLTPAYIVSTYYYGAFWTKLGNKESVKQSLQEKPVSTVATVAKNAVLGNLIHYQYMIRIGEEVVGDMLLKKIEKSSQTRPVLTSNLVKSMYAVEKAKATYWNMIGRYLV